MSQKFRFVHHNSSPTMSFRFELTNFALKLAMFALNYIKFVTNFFYETLLPYFEFTQPSKTRHHFNVFNQRVFVFLMYFKLHPNVYLNVFAKTLFNEYFLLSYYLANSFLFIYCVCYRSILFVV